MTDSDFRDDDVSWGDVFRLIDPNFMVGVYLAVIAAVLLVVLLSLRFGGVIS